MRCLSCGTENKAGRKFCSGCGGALPLACPKCGAHTESGDRFCGDCGAALGESKPAAAVEEDLRPVTILFADLSGYTRLSNTLEPDETRELLNAFFAEADGAVAAAGGRVDKHIGDCVMAVFGAPIAHGDDTLRAVSAALDIRERTRALAQARQVTLDSHSGLATGLVAAGDTGSDVHKSYTVIGRAVNLAARLCDGAEAGEILVTTDIAQAVAAHFAFEAEQAIAVDGFDQAVKVARLSGQETAAAAHSPDLVDRTHEQQLIKAALEAARATGHGQVVILRGEAGLGKSRLIEEIARHAATQGFAVLIAQVTSFGSGPDADPMRAALRALAGDGAEALAHRFEEARLPAHMRALGHEMAGHAVPADIKALLAALDAEARETGRAELLVALARHAAETQPLLLIAEDMHWAGREMVPAMARIAGALADLPAIVLLTVRPEADPFDAAWRAMLGATPATTLDLGPLPVADATSLAANLARESASVQRIVERAGGNPLFLVQLSQFAFETEAELPGSIRSLVAARFDQLSPESRGVLQAAAVLGLRFARADLAFMREAQQAPIDELIARQFLRPASGTIEFAHALVRDAIYDMLPKSRRKRLHGRAAQRFAAMNTALEAHHLERAGEPTAPRAYWRAAEEARLAYRQAEARELNGRGLAIATVEDRLDLLMQRGEILLDLGDGREAETVWREAATLSKEPSSTARAEVGIAQALRLLGRGEEAREALVRAEAVADPDRDAEILSLLHFVRGNLLFPLGRYEDCVNEHRVALDLARRAGSAEAEARALGGIGDAEYLRGRVTSAATAFGECIALAERHGFARVALANRPMSDTCRMLCGELAPALASAEAAIRQAAEIGARRAEMIGQHVVCMGQLERENFPGALAAAARAGELAAELGARHFASEAVLYRAKIELHGGARAEALGTAREALAISREAGMSFMGAVCLAALAAASEDEAERAGAIAEMEALLAKGCIAHSYYMSYRLLIHAAASRRDWAETRRWADALERFAAAEPFFYATLMVEAGRVLARHGDGEPGATESVEKVAADAKAHGYTLIANWLRDRLNMAN